MRLPAALSLVACATGVAASTPSNPRNAGTKAANIVDSAYIVRLSLASSSFTGRDEPGAAHREFHKRATDLGLDYDVRREYSNNPLIFHGLAINLHNGSIGDIEAVSGVEAVYPVAEYERVAPHGRSRQKPSSTLSAVQSKQGKRDTSANTTAPAALPRITGTSDINSSLKIAGVDKLHDLGIKGSGLKIGLIDTGVDYNHPALGGGFGAGYKVAGGYAYRDDDGNAVSSSDPLTTCLTGGHGTHVAGIAAMQDPDSVGFGLVGVAPEATIYMYRVFGCEGTATTDDIIAALNQAYTDGVDVVSMSLASALVWEVSDPFTNATSALVNEGIAVIAAAGNDGSRAGGAVGGLFYPSSPAIGPDVFAVGCVENDEFPTVYSMEDSAGTTFEYASVWPLSLYAPEDGLSVYVLGGDGSGCNASDWEDAAAAVGANVDTTLVVFHSDWNGEDCDFADKETYWAQNGFNYIMDYTTENSDPYSQQYVLLEQDDNSTRYTNVLQDTGVAIASAYAKAGGYPNYQFTFPIGNVSSAAMDTAGTVSYFSSFGPTWDTLELKPQASAPGASILSTWPMGFNAGYAALRGTSMAAPFVAASYALIKSQRPDLSVHDIYALLQSTASPTSSAYYPDLLASTAQQGSGVINAYAALQASSSVLPTQFALGDTDTYEGVQLSFTLSNSGTDDLTYTIANDGAAMMYYHPFGIHPFVPEQALWDTQPEYAVYASLSTSSSSVSVAAGGSTAVSFTLAPPASSSFNESLIPLISGFLKVTSSAGDTFSIPYQGLPYSRYNAQYIDLAVHTLNTSASAPWPLLYQYAPDDPAPAYGEADAVWNNQSGIFVVDKKPIIIDDLAVGLLANILQPSKNIRVDLLPANTTYNATYYGYDRSVKWNYVPIATGPGYLNTLADGTYPTYGLINGDVAWEPVDEYFEFWDDLNVETTSDEYEDEGGLAPTAVGDYRILLSALRWGGDATVLDDYETWLSPILRVKDGGLPNSGLPAGTPG